MWQEGRRRAEWLDGYAAEYARVANTNIHREFPNSITSLMREPGDAPDRPSRIHPVFFGSFDWHSCVEMHWVLVRLLRSTPGGLPSDAIRSSLDALLTEPALAGEAATFRVRSAHTRPYGWGWALALAHELGTWADPDGRRWSAYFAPLAEAVVEAFVEWLPKATYPVRHGLHGNSAFGMARALPYARARAADGEPALLEAIAGAAQRWFGTDAGYPAAWEPSGTDFLSPALTEAELMADLLAEADFPMWLDRFLPGLAAGEPATLFSPAVVSDDSDGMIAHLHGLNLHRAWGWRRIAESLPEADPRLDLLAEAAARHAEAELGNVSGGDYAVEHWLVAYAVLYLS
ncbi:hypothetical protein CFN78_03555 [Amycolatopsis antarctica]|uniref:DUF2891 domain-containing protein n=2 Tax=Amycolatopsis antarctica TaxID=1854586 RepID=A0A263D8A0_9PSEU|nr:hypothetical protein CFN78_03555 [Amycolatopsis antarctica]